jgi:very-short-patch-repair endonuclease
MHLGSKGNTFKNANILKKEMTEAEIILWNALRNCRLNGFKFRRQHPVLRFIADFYCHEAKLIVEIDGDIHNNFTRQEYDEGRSNELNEYGIKVIRFSNNDVMNKLNEVLQRINLEITGILSNYKSI